MSESQQEQVDNLLAGLEAYGRKQVSLVCCSNAALGKYRVSWSTLTICHSDVHNCCRNHGRWTIHCSGAIMMWCAVELQPCPGLRSTVLLWRGRIVVASPSKSATSFGIPACRPTPAPGTANRGVNVRNLVLHNRLHILCLSAADTLQLSSMHAAAGGRFRDGLGRLLFATRRLCQAVFRPDVAVNKAGQPGCCACAQVAAQQAVLNGLLQVEFALFNLIRGAIGLRGKLKAVGDDGATVKVSDSRMSALAPEGTGHRELCCCRRWTLRHHGLHFQLASRCGWGLQALSRWAPRPPRLQLLPRIVRGSWQHVSAGQGVHYGASAPSV